MPKPKKSKVEPVRKEETPEEEARRLMPPPPPRSPKRKPPARPVEPDSPGLPARNAAKSTTAEWKKLEQFAAQAMRKATAAHERAGKLFDGQLKRVDRLERQKTRPANDPYCFRMNERLQRAELKYRDAYLKMEQSRMRWFAAKAELSEAKLAQKELRIKQLLRRVRMLRML